MSTEDFRLPFPLPFPIHLRISHAGLDFIKIIFEILSCFFNTFPVFLSFGHTFNTLFSYTDTRIVDKPLTISPLIKNSGTFSCAAVFLYRQ